MFVKECTLPYVVLCLSVYLLAHILQRLATLHHPLLAMLLAVQLQDLQIQSLLVSVEMLV